MAVHMPSPTRCLEYGTKKVIFTKINWEVDLFSFLKKRADVNIHIIYWKSLNVFVCLYVCIDRFKSRVTTLKGFWSKKVAQTFIRRNIVHSTQTLNLNRIPLSPDLHLHLSGRHPVPPRHVGALLPLAAGGEQVLLDAAVVVGLIRSARARGETVWKRESVF